MLIDFLIIVIIVSSIGAALAAILVISERYIANYGACKININDQKNIEIQGGNSLLSTLTDQKIFIPSACGGKGTCGLCKVKVISGAGQLLPTEEPYLDKDEKNSNVRLSCQVKVRNDLQILIPAELFSIQEFICKCIEIVDLTHDIKQFRLELLQPNTMNYTPGQYVQLLAPVYPKSSEEVYRAYSISSDPSEKNFIELIIRLVPRGICTTYCFEYLKAGDSLKINGPYGNFKLSDTDVPILFIAGGSGMAPIKCMLHHMKNTKNQRQATYYFGANSLKDMFLMDTMRQLESEIPNFKFIPVISSPAHDDNWKGRTGYVTQAVQQDFTDVSNYEAYLCGSPGMIDACVKVLTGLKMPEDKIYYDKFT
jgi:Na+-transporting NADH:ubiquinone oxidoreductase subunit F